ncbi:OmpA family protein [Aurantimonas sp. VKM B-3413]|uniref:OmpA family protein n=1 Tax=Aurantimonas sp. VKM B-3413 TaxID=2779401 RepID=UPI001E35E734|nr:OmpA family protein [Aurantimonas sp. VKM B-3413]MCB8838422.1 OmpA family protein [Aurantimonas sp. VKM B-3413]
MKTTGVSGRIGPAGRTRLLGGLFLAAILVPQAAIGQGISLDSFEFESIAPSATGEAKPAPSPQASVPAAAPDLSDCLVSAGSACGGSAQKAARSFSLDDLQNLGVIANEPEPPALAVVGTSQQELARAEAERAEKRAEPLPSIDVEVLFAYNDAQPLPSERWKIDELARAMADPRLVGKRFVLMGHTDAAGGDAYNLELSRRRSEALAFALERASGLSPDRFITAGRGERDLKNPLDPDSPENRRVQIVLLDR